MTIKPCVFYHDIKDNFLNDCLLVYIENKSIENLV